MLNSATTGSFIEVSSDLLARGYRIRFRAAGGSMRPSIADGDILTIERRATCDLAVGAVAVYRHRNRVFAHRVVGIGLDHDGSRVLVFRGDAVATCDAPVGVDQILGEVIEVQRGRGLTSRLAFAFLRGTLRTAVAPMRRISGRLAYGTCLAATRVTP